MLRALGAQRSGAETDNISACRDLTGRRLAHVEGEKKYEHWFCLVCLLDIKVNIYNETFEH